MRHFIVIGRPDPIDLLNMQRFSIMVDDELNCVLIGNNLDN